ncbi:MAG: branched-chain amino acid aminotransferase [Oscillospiraceae bacterium]|jgi:branched-chain amino acid aminotransferase|nr:branched-chain amino acid aminotransferase [Oscillospiraceae bacterium]
MSIAITRAETLKRKPDSDKLGFGQYFSDHMFLMNYDEGQGWHDARLVPYAPFLLEPAAMVFHYAQEVFEGLKAYRRADGGIQLFRPDMNIARMRVSCERLCIPPVDDALYLEAIKALVDLERDWVPSEPDTSLYLRPFIIATEPHIGVHASKSYIFAIIASPVGAYYSGGINPVKIYVETKDVRAVKGGMGHTKTGGNYAATLRAGKQVEKFGFSQVLWLDGIHRKYIEEVGAMNVFFRFGDEIATPALQGSILPGVTRDSCLAILRDWGLNVNERVIDAVELNHCDEAWGTGTAAVISPIGEISYDGRQISINNGQIGNLTQKLYDFLTGIQWGRVPDPFGWTVPVEQRTN